MAVFYVNIFQNDIYMRETGEYGDIHFRDLNGRVKILVSFSDKLGNYSFFEEQDRQG